jgi:hypothetical protein
MTELVRAFRAGEVAAFKKLLPSVDLSGIDTKALFYTLFDSQKLSEQAEMMDMIKRKI